MRRRTTTSNFGVGARESHDASKFYERFRAPELSTDDTVLPPTPVPEPFVCGDARSMDTIADGSVALVVTSPPYFAGKQYEEELERDGIPSSYLEYLEMLTAVFADCVRTLEPGGRLAINVANLGRKPYRSLSADVIQILEHDLGLLLRGEIVWQKGDGASGSCAWGSYRGAGNPVLRDVSERIVVASKGRFDRARKPPKRAAAGLPSRSTILAEDFMNLTLDVWSIPPESAKRVGHPAPFPVELPEQLIRLYTYEDDLVLDPFMGSGSTMVAASRLRRRYVGYDLDPAYVELSRQRVADEGAPIDDDPLALDGRPVGALAEERLTQAGFTITGRDVRVRGTGITIAFTANAPDGREWWFDIAGGLTAHRSGLHRNETVWRALGRGAAVLAARGERPLILLATGGPKPRTEGDVALRAGAPAVFTDVIDLLDRAHLTRLSEHARTDP
jgi:DNA modification methylase